VLDLSRLSAAQRRVALAGDGPLLVLAGPGSGKSTALAARVACLVAYRHVPPASVLAITFTTAAARALRARLQGVLGPRGGEVDVATFHSLGLRVVRRWGDALGYGLRPPAVYDRRDARALLAQACGAVGLDPERWLRAGIAGALDRFRLSGHAPFAQQRPVLDGVPAGGGAGDLAPPALAELARAYEAGLRRREAVDFPAMLTLPLDLFTQFPPALRVLQDAYRYVVCDEGQDVCRTQYLLLRSLAARHRNLVLVADPRQTIYGWRGADARCLAAFRQDFPDVRTLALDQNFRSSARLVAVANVYSAALGYGPRLWTANPPGATPRRFAAADEQAEAEFVAGQIERLTSDRGGAAPGDVAVLYRTRRQATEVAVALRARRLPYRVRGEGDLFARPEVRDAVAYLRLAHNPGDGAALARIANSSPRRLARLADALSRAGGDLVGRCPFHPDGGRPNFYVYARSNRWRCHRCAVGGDVLDFVQRIEGVGFLEAARILSARRPPRSGVPGSRSTAVAGRAPESRERAGRRLRLQEPAARACLAAAVELYANRLLTEPRALAYAEGRGLDRATLERFCVGYAAGDELADLLRWRGLPVPAAVRAGLLSRNGRERLAGRIVVPELRGGAPVWLVGRTIDPGANAPKYLGLPGPKPLLGWEHAREAEMVVVVEGVFDLLVLGRWGLPGVALVGTHLGARGLADLEPFRRLYVALDADDAGRAATSALVARLGARATPVRLPALQGVKDVADLATLPGGREAFLAALADAARTAPESAPYPAPGGRHDTGTLRAGAHDTGKGV
jgi:DNA primase catalytic core